MNKSDVSTPKSGGRRTETPAQKLQRLEREMLLAKEQVKAQQQRTLAAMAAALIAEAREGEEFMRALHEILSRRMNKADLAHALELLDQGTPGKRKQAA